MSEAANCLILTASLVARDAMRYTPAGVPALNLELAHASSVREAGQVRQVKLGLKALALGSNAERLTSQAIGSNWRFTGFLATPRNGKHVVFHIQEFTQDPSISSPQDASAQVV
ncbi:MAG: primosomal replication protein N [Xanthomonadales bacterium]|nr:primosomal replication protein N [Xanthomonadales bacterium]